MIKQSDRNRQILMEYITTDKSIVDLAKEYKLTRQRIHRIIETESQDEEMIEKMEKYLEKVVGQRI